MTAEKPNDKEATFAENYERLARAWVEHEDLRLAGASISDLYRSSLHLSEARDQMWAWWSKYRLQGVR